jgi:uncharacterized RDD family membrane protein YckC
VDVSGVSYVGFWKRAWAALTDALFFQLVAFLVVLAAFRSDYVSYIEAKFATIMALALDRIDFAAVRRLDSGPYSPRVAAFYLWLPAVATLIFWLVMSATPGLMAIPARIVDVRTGAKPSIMRLLLRYVASFLLGYTCGVDYLWIALSRRKQAVHDVIARTAVMHAPEQVGSGEWARPNRRVVAIYIVIAIVAILLNFGLDWLLFNPAAPGTKVLSNLQIASYLHEMPRPLWLECVSLIAVALAFTVPPLLFRFSLRWLDRWWLVAMSLAFAGGLCNIMERAFTGGVRDIYYVEGALRYLCLSCGLAFKSYYANPADLFQSIGLYSLPLILLVSRFWLVGRWFRSSLILRPSTVC